MPKKYRNKDGEMLYIFAWEGGGGNNVFAPSKAVARKRAVAMGKGVSDSYGRPYDYEIARSVVLVPRMDTLRAVTTFQEYLDFDRCLASMCW